MFQTLCIVMNAGKVPLSSLTAGMNWRTNRAVQSFLTVTRLRPDSQTLHEWLLKLSMPALASNLSHLVFKMLALSGSFQQHL